MKTIFNTLKPIFSDKVLKIFGNQQAYRELMRAIEAERKEGEHNGDHVVHINGRRLKLVRIK